MSEENTTTETTATPETQVELTNARQDAAKYRVGRNDALKREFALKEVLKAHNISFDTESIDTSGMTIANGNVSGEYKYVPPQLARQSAQVAPVANDNGSVLTLDAVKNMTEAEINSRWDEVSKILTKKP